MPRRVKTKGAEELETLGELLKRHVSVLANGETTTPDEWDIDIHIKKPGRIEVNLLYRDHTEEEREELESRLEEALKSRMKSRRGL